jgi:S-DNA-T family DNA segregation ATPase FtsK/SpoIIIE
MANRLKEKYSSTTEETDNVKKKVKENPKSEKNIPKVESGGWLSFIQSVAFQRVLGLGFITIAIFMVISFSSYFFTWKADQDKIINNEWWYILTDKNIVLDNTLNKLGALISHFFFYNGFGISSYLFIPLIFCFGMNLLLQQKVFHIFRILRNVFFWTIWISIALTFTLSNWIDFPVGGAFGKVTIEKINSIVNTTGTGILILVALISALIVKGIISELMLIRLKNFFIDTFKQLFHSKDKSEKIEKKLDQDVEKDIVHEEESISPKQMINDFYAEKRNILKQDTQEIAQETSIIEAEMPFLKTKVELELDKEINTSFDINDLKESSFEVIYTDSNNDGFADGLKPIELNVAEEVSLSDIEEITSEDENAEFEIYDPTKDLSFFKFPTLDLLEQYNEEKVTINKEELEKNKDQIIATLLHFKIEVSKIKATVGPTVTLYEIVPAPGVRISKIKNLEDDIALSLAALGIRIIAPIPGKGTIGIEVPNTKPETVSMRTILESEKFQEAKMALPLALGKNIANEVFVADLAKMPHLLIAGATGQGKSVGINAVIASLLYKKHPSELKLVMVDPKKVELSLYARIEKHYLAILPGVEEPIITDTSKVVNTLNALCIEMDNRYELLKDAGVRNLREYNEKFQKRKLSPLKGHRFLPYIVLIVDEFADLIMTAGKEVEMPIARLAQLARAIGIHLIIATQRPSVNVITGIIKANFPARIAFKVTAKVDSRTILDQGGADQLIGRGDMLLSVDGNTIRLQCAFIDTPEVERIVTHISAQQGYAEAYLLPEYVGENEKKNNDDEKFNPKELDPFFEDAARVIVQNQQGSTSLIQRRLKLGYNRAGRLMDQLEAAGIVGPNLGSKARDVLITTEYELDEFLKNIH